METHRTIGRGVSLVDTALSIAAACAGPERSTGARSVPPRSMQVNRLCGHRATRRRRPCIVMAPSDVIDLASGTRPAWRP